MKGAATTSRTITTAANSAISAVKPDRVVSGIVGGATVGFAMKQSVTTAVIGGVIGGIVTHLVTKDQAH
jgi:uncharacterized membrane protein